MMTEQIRRGRGKILGAITLIATMSASLASQDLPRVTFVPHWLPQAQFAGFFVAKERGVYRRHGLDVTILTGGPGVSAPSLLRNGKVDFALMWLSNAIQLKANRVDIVNVAQLLNRSALMLVAKKNRGIHTPQDMNGKRVGLWGGDFQIQPMAFFKKFHLDVKPVAQGSSINLFFFDGIDVTSAMWYNEYHTILASGFRPDELDTFFFSDWGLNFPEDGIYCSSKMLSSNPGTCTRFVLASLEGWTYAFNHPEEALETVAAQMQNAGLPFNKAHQRWMLTRMKDLMFPGGRMDAFGELSKVSYLLVAENLREEGLIRIIPAYEEIYKPATARKTP